MNVYLTDPCILSSRCLFIGSSLKITIIKDSHCDDSAWVINFLGIGRTSSIFCLHWKQGLGTQYANLQETNIRLPQLLGSGPQITAIKREMHEGSLNNSSPISKVSMRQQKKYLEEQQMSRAHVHSLEFEVVDVSKNPLSFEFDFVVVVSAPYLDNALCHDQV
eukprot:Gb_06183 [translate_table: standard]